MESSGYNFWESGLPFLEGIDGFNNIRNLLKGGDAETFWVQKNFFEGQGFIDHHLPEIKENLVHHPQFLKDSLSDANCDSGVSLQSTSTITMNSSAEFDKSLSSLATRTNDKDLIANLKIEKLESPRELKDGSVSVEESAKRARVTNLQSQIPVCIVHGCNKDLSTSKEYHKRHKVCDVHSKTAVVIVNGVQQRFCQQCSRFHILAEFDNGKRSCRKRLAGHNERRRKPQLESHFGSTYCGTDLYRTSFLFSTHPQCNNEPIRHSSHQTELLQFGSSSPPPLLQHNPSKYCPSSPLSVLELSAAAISNTSCAPSLLSAQSDSSFSHSATDYPPPFNPNTSNFRGFFCSPSCEADQGAILECGTRSEPRNALGADTVNLLQLSLHLQRVEHQKQSEQGENGIYSDHEHLMQ